MEMLVQRPPYFMREMLRLLVKSKKQNVEDYIEMYYNQGIVER